MQKRVQQAIEYMNGSYSCSQAVMCAFCDEVKISHDEAKRIAAPYAGGAKIKCGAICAANLILEAKFGKAESVELQKKFEESFLSKNGAINCRDIRSKNLRSCVGCVEDSAIILENML